MDVWGDLPKSQVDNNTVNDEIDELIAVHLADPDAHLETGQSLQSHKASEIIDHLAESVVNDKLRPNGRAFVAIVDLAGTGDYTDIQEALNYAFLKGGGTVYIMAGRYYLEDNLYVPMGVNIVGDGMNETILDFQDEEYAVIGPTRDILPDFWFYDDPFTLNSKIVEFSGDVNLYTSKVTKGMQLGISGPDVSVGVIDEIIDEKTLSLVDNYTNTEEFEGGFSLVFAQFTNGSKIVTFPEGVDLIALGVKPNYYIDDYALGVDSYLIESVDSATQLTLAVAYISTTRFTDINITPLSAPVNKVSDLGVLNSIADFAFQYRDQEYVFNLENIYFDNVKGLIQSLSYYRFSYCKNLLIKNSGGDYLFDVSRCQIENAHIEVDSATIAILKARGEVYFKDSYVYIDSSLSVALFDFAENNLTIFGIHAVNLYKFDYVNRSRYNAYISNNDLEFIAVPDCQFHNNNSVIANNSFNTNASYGLILSSTADDNIVHDNIIEKAIVDSGTNNSVHDNLVN